MIPLISKLISRETRSNARYLEGIIKKEVASAKAEILLEVAELKGEIVKLKAGEYKDGSLQTPTEMTN